MYFIFVQPRTKVSFFRRIGPSFSESSLINASFYAPFTSMRTGGEGTPFGRTEIYRASVGTGRGSTLIISPWSGAGPGVIVHSCETGSVYVLPRMKPSVTSK